MKKRLRKKIAKKAIKYILYYIAKNIFIKSPPAPPRLKIGGIVPSQDGNLARLPDDHVIIPNDIAEKIIESKEVDVNIDTEALMDENKLNEMVKNVRKALMKGDGE